MDYLAWSTWKNEDILTNGMKVWHRQVPMQTAVLCAIVDAGSRFDGSHPGIAHFVEHMLFQGTKNFPDEQIKLMAAKNGISINASTSKEFLTVDLESILPDKIDTALKICQEVIVNPAFSKDSFNKERAVVLNEIRDKEDRSLSKAIELANAMICEHPFKIPVLGTKQAIEALSVEEMIMFHGNRFRPEHITICYAGPMDMQKFVSLCNEKFGSWRGNATSGAWPIDKFVSFSPGNVLHKANQSQVAVVIAYPGSAVESEDKIKLKALCDIIGGGAMVSRMFRQLRNQQGLCYFCGAFSQDFYMANGMLSLCGNVSPDKTEEFITGALKIIEDVRSKAPITEQELQTTKTRFKAEMLETVDNLSSYMQWFLYLWISHGTRDIGKDLEMVEALTVDDLTTMANKYFGKEPKIALVGNIIDKEASKIKMRAEDFQYQAPTTGGYSTYDGAGTVDRPTPAGSHATTPNSTKPSTSGADRKAENMDDVLKPKDGEEENTGNDTMQDTEPSCIPKAKSACKSCGAEFEHLEGVAVYKCPDCKMHDIDATQPPKKVSIYGKNKSTSLQDITPVPMKPTPGRDVVANPIAGVPGRPLKAPNIVSPAPKAEQQKPAPLGAYKDYSEKQLDKQAEDQARASEWAGIAKGIGTEAPVRPPAPIIPGVNTPTMDKGAPPPEIQSGGEYDENRHQRDEHGRFAPKAG